MACHYTPYIRGEDKSIVDGQLPGVDTQPGTDRQTRERTGAIPESPDMEDIIKFSLLVEQDLYINCIEE